MAHRTAFCALLMIAILAASSLAQAQLFRTYLSSEGDDANPCSLPQPCRLLPAALAAVASGGEVWILDSANFNTATVSITKPVSILAIPGQVGSLVARDGTPAISISTAGLRVSLKNLVFGPLVGTPGNWGVMMTANSELTVDGCTFANLTNGGVNIQVGRARVVNTLVRNTTNGLYISAGANVTVANTQVLGSSQNGILVGGTTASSITSVDVSDSIISNGLQQGAGIYTDVSSSTATANVMVTRSTISLNNVGIVSSAPVGVAHVVVGSSTIANNATYGLQQNAPALLSSYGNNQIRLNGIASTAGTISSATPQ